MAGLLEGKVTLITGAAAGIGRATADLGAREGARLVLADIDEAAGIQAAREIEASGREATFIRADVSDEAQIRRMLDHTLSTYGRLDCAFNNVGIPQTPRSVVDIPLAEWTRVLTVNLTGCFLCLQHQIPLLLQQSSAAIVNMASFAGLAATPMMAAYSSSKFGLIGLTKSAAAEYAKSGLRINAVCPTATATEGMSTYLQGLGVDPATAGASYPSGRMANPAEIAELVVWLLSERSSYINGQAVCATGGPSGVNA